LPEMGRLQRLARRFAVGGVLRVGDGDPGVDGRGQRGDGGGTRRAVFACPEDDAALRVKLLGAGNQAPLLLQLGNIGLVGGGEDIEGRSAFDLAGQQAGRAEHQLHLLPGFLLVGGGDLGEGSGQVGGGGHAQFRRGLAVFAAADQRACRQYQKASCQRSRASVSAQSSLLPLT